ncbi:MAG: acetylornithine deacetylase or succinyl-diaminopimelate desuccinylase [Bacillota bacterium]|jgi:acetylornithine deacetylase/succinyl-diaminopimelate desuccinylase|nr:acetylornithine deacetylase or succinyl-diaminopimelate desuccinylase [Bacillota bacterium]
MEVIMTDTVYKHLSDYFTEEEAVSLLTKLVSFPSHEGVFEQETAAAAFLCDFFRKEGIETELVPVLDGRCNVLARLKGSGGGRSLLFTGHTDTVPPYDMKGDPYEARIDQGKMYGRGVVDMKAGLVCMILAMAAIKRAGITLPGDLIFAGVIDEESKSEGTRAYLRSGELPDAAIVSEPSNMQICIGHRGLEWFEFTFHGKTVHGGRQKEGINAIQKAMKFIHELEAELIPSIEARVNSVVGNSSMNYGLIKGGTQPSTVAGECILQIDRRWIPGETFTEIKAEYQAVLDRLKASDPDFKAEFKVMDVSYMDDQYIHEALYTSPEDPIVRIAEKAVNEVMGKASELTSFPAWTDGGLINYYGSVPTIILGPGELGSAHSAEEHIEISALVPAVSIYCSIACAYCSEELGN